MTKIKSIKIKLKAFIMCGVVLINSCFLYAQQIPKSKNFEAISESADSSVTLDYTLKELVKICRDEKFKIKLADGEIYIGKIKIVEDGIKIKKSPAKLTGSESWVFISWEEIEVIQLLRNKSNRWLYFIGIPAIIIASIYSLFNGLNN